MNIFEFTNFREYMNQRFSSAGVGARAARKSASLEEVSKELGYKSPSLLSMVLNGKRLPSEELVDALMDTWDLSASERNYFRLLVQLAKYKARGKDTSDLVRKIRKQSGVSEQEFLAEYDFSAIKEWHYLVIKTLVDSPNFREDPKWISQALRRKITPSQAKEALDTLEVQRLIERDPVTGRLRSPNFVESAHEAPSPALREHHKGMLARAAEAIEEQSVEQRQFNALTFRLDPAQMPEVKARIVSFMKSLYAEYESAQADSVYQLNVQLFEHTKIPNSQETNDATH